MGSPRVGAGALWSAWAFATRALAARAICRWLGAAGGLPRVARTYRQHDCVVEADVQVVYVDSRALKLSLLTCHVTRALLFTSFQDTEVYVKCMQVQDPYVFFSEVISVHQRCLVR